MMQLQNIFWAVLSPGAARVAASGAPPHPPGPPATPPLSFVIPEWHIGPAPQDGTTIASLSVPGVDVSSWHHITTSRCTLMDCLLHAGVYHDAELFFSDNLRSFNRSQFAVPWLYRNEFVLGRAPGQHYFLQTHGIGSKADILLNGLIVATKETQAGSYGGHTYEITQLLQPTNALLIQAHPTDYNYDFAQGFVDWNPYPPDNGTGVWRDVSVKQTGPVALGSLRINTDFDLPVGPRGATVTLRAVAQNLEDREVAFVARSLVLGGKEDPSPAKDQEMRLAPYESADISMKIHIEKPAIWWPRAWGDQPLYHAKLTVSMGSALSDTVEQSFGIRKVSSQVNEYNDTVFSINEKPFQVIGGGYGPDMFLRWDKETFETQAQYMLDLGHNTVRLEGKMEHPELYDITDRLGLMVMPGWECCDKWEAWSYNNDLAVKSNWTSKDYQIANFSMRHEAAMLQAHPSVLTFLVGSDYWPDDNATAIYREAFASVNWPNPIIASASKRGYPEALGPSGMKMDGPYDWVPPNYWYDTEPSADRFGAAFGLGSELGTGVGTPELGSLRKFLTPADLDDLWKQPNKGLYHMSTNVSSFYDRRIYNDALWKRLGAPASLEDYVLKAQIMDYEATRAQFEAFAARWSAAPRPATGLIYWMLNNAWPSLHWNLFDYYLRPAGAYYGAKTGARLEHVAFDYLSRDLYLINHSLDRAGPRTVAVDVVGLDGAVLHHATVPASTVPNTSQKVYTVPARAHDDNATDVVFLRLRLRDDRTQQTLSRNVYWVARTLDRLDWAATEWFYTPVAAHADYTALDRQLGPANVSVSVSVKTTTTTAAAAAVVVDEEEEGEKGAREVVLENHSTIPAFFVSLAAVDGAGADVAPVLWSDNYVTLLPRERLRLEVRFPGGRLRQKKPAAAASALRVSGKNVVGRSVPFA